MSSSSLPDEIDAEKLAEGALAILSLTLGDDGRGWRRDWTLMDLPHDERIAAATRG